MLVVAECWHPGWRAEVDGIAAPVHRVNYLQQGIWLEQGSHVVQLRFIPQAIYCGVLVSALSALIFVSVAVGSAIVWRAADRKAH